MTQSVFVLRKPLLRLVWGMGLEGVQTGARKDCEVFMSVCFVYAFLYLCMSVCPSEYLYIPRSLSLAHPMPWPPDLPSLGVLTRVQEPSQDIGEEGLAQQPLYMRALHQPAGSPAGSKPW